MALAQEENVEPSYIIGLLLTRCKALSLKSVGRKIINGENINPGVQEIPLITACFNNLLRLQSWKGHIYKAETTSEERWMSNFSIVVKDSRTPINYNTRDSEYSSST